MRKIQGKSTEKTFVYMHSAARHMLELAKQSQEGSLYTAVAVRVFSAFMVEAYINHLGSLRHETWRERERKLSKLSKLTMLSAEVGVQLEAEGRPFKTVKDLFNFRDSMAHGKTVTRDISLELSQDTPIAKALASVGWCAELTIPMAEQEFNDAADLIRKLHKASGDSRDPFFSAGSGMYVSGAVGA